MLDRFTTTDMRNLLRNQSPPCVTIYLPTARTGAETLQGPIRLKRLVGKANAKLSGHWMSDVDAVKFLSPITRMIDDHEYWQNTDQGLALFLDSNELKSWRVAASFQEQLAVSDQFFVRQILSSANTNDAFYVLAIGQNELGFFEANRNSIHRLSIPGLPDNMEQALNLSSVERGSQVHTGSREFRGKQSIVFHGHGGARDSTKEELQTFYRQIDSAVSEYLRDGRQPLILACVANQAPIYRKINSYPYLLDQIVSGAAEHRSPKRLLDQVWTVMSAHLVWQRDEALDNYRNHVDTPQTTCEIREIVTSAHQGRLSDLFVDTSVSVKGKRYETSSQAVDDDDVTTDYDWDLVEEAIAQSVLHGTAVHALPHQEMPIDAPMVATLRF